MIIIAIVGVVFAALAVTGVWLDTQDPQELRDMGVVLGYKDAQAIDSVVVAKPEHRHKRRATKATKRTTHARTYPAKVVHRVGYTPRAGGVH